MFSADDPAVRLRDFMMRMSGEQMAWQAPEFHSLARTAAPYLHTLFPTHRWPRFIKPGWEAEIFGCSLSDYVGTAQLMWAAALTCAGRFDPEAIFGSADGQRFAATVGQHTVEQVAGRHFTIDTATFKKAEQRSVTSQQRLAGASTGLYRRFAYNPLAGRPAVTGCGPGLLCPSPSLVWRKAIPPGIYHTGREHFGPDFLQETGYLFEEYIGRQLRLIPHTHVLGEITYTKGKNELQSVDWLVVFDDLVLLVEVKSMMPTESSRLGLERGVAETDAKLTRAYRQINRTSALIDQRHPAITDIPSDRPRQALVVTLEPLPVPNAHLPHLDLPTPDIPTAVTSSQEIERLVTLADITPSALLLERAADPERSTWAINECLTSHSFGRNRVLDQGWASYPWAAGKQLAPAQAP